MSLLHNQIDFLLLLLHYFKLAYMTSFMVIKWCLGYYKWLCCGAKWTIALQHSVMTKNETCVLKLRSHIIVSLRLYQHVFAIACLLPFDLMYVDLFCHHDGAQLLVLLPLLTIQWMYASKISMLIIHVMHHIWSFPECHIPLYMCSYHQRLSFHKGNGIIYLIYQSLSMHKRVWMLFIKYLGERIIMW